MGPTQSPRGQRPQQGRYPTRVDVARRAGTSTAVVSYVVNDGPRRVAPATRARVLEAMQDLGYRPNALARSLRASRSRALGLVVPDLANPFFAELARSVEDAVFGSGNALLVGNSMGDEDREARYVRTFLEYRIDGLAVVPVSDGHQTLGQLEHTAVRVVVLDRDLKGLDQPTIVPDNSGGAYAATRHLLDHGHPAVACIAGPRGLTTAEERVAGWQRALDDAGVARRGRTVLRTAFGQEAGFRAAARLLGLASPPTALFVASDEQAFGVLAAAARAGVRVPGELAMVGFDGLQDSRFTVPGLTTMRQPIREAGALAVRMLLDGAAAEDGRLVRLPVTLQRRGSCGCPNVFDGGRDHARA